MIPIIEATDINDAWFQALWNIFKLGRVYTIDHGSFKGQKRLEYPFITINIRRPGDRPLTPTLPERCSFPPPVEDGYIENYIRYIMTSEKHPNEDYTYGQDLERQIAAVIKMYHEHGHNTNQACMTVGDKFSIDMPDPPCLKIIDTRIIDNQLHFVVYFRSNDLWSGFPANLAGLQLLKEYMAGEIGVDDGQILYSSKGLHLYEYAWPMAADRTGMCDEGSPYGHGGSSLLG